jgi:hypothetical protein
MDAFLSFFSKKKTDKEDTSGNKRDSNAADDKKSGTKNIKKDNKFDFPGERN